MRCFALAVSSILVGASVSQAEPASKPAPPDRRWAVSVCDGYLRGIGADDIWSAARAIGISRIEAGVKPDLSCPNLFEKDGSPYRLDTPAARTVLRTKLAKEGFTIGCLCLGIKLSADGPDDAALEWVRRAAEAAPEIGCRTIMLPIGIQAPGGGKVSDEVFLTRAQAFVRALDPIAAATGVQFALENLGHYWNRPEILEPVLRKSRPDRVGLLLDITNMYWYGFPLDRLYDLAKQFAPYVRYVHAKNVRYPEDQRQKQRTPGWEYGKYAEPIRTGDIDFGRIIGLYAKAGYVGDVTIEDDSLPRLDAAGRKKALLDDVAFLRHVVRRFPPVTGSIGNVKSHRLDGNALYVQCTGGWARLTACEPAVIRLEAAPDENTRSGYQAFDVRKLADARVTVEDFDDHIDFATEKLICQVDKRPFRVTYYWSDPKGRLTQPAPGPAVEWTADGVRTRFQLADRERERIYGLNLNFHGFERRGRVCEVKTNADPTWDNGHSHLVSPFYASTYGYGVFLNNTGYSMFRIDDEGDGIVTILAPGPVLDWYYIHGGGMRDVIARYTTIIGRIDMPARWGLGLWYRAESKWKQDQVLATANEFRARRIPCDVIGLEPGWQSHAYPCSYTWNKDAYPDPAGLLRELNVLELRLNLWTHAYVHSSSPLYQQLLDAACAGDKPVWGGLVPDFTLPRTREIFDKGFASKQIDMGVAGYKLDECDGSDTTGGWFFPDDARFPSGRTGAQMHNILGATCQDAFHEMYRRRDQRTYFLCRANFATGLRRPTAVYSDLYDLRSYLRAQATAGFLGALWCPEVRETRNAEDLVRRSQLMFLGALAQFDGWASGVVPWDKGPGAEAIFRRYAELRMRLLPYLYGEFWRMHTTGVPVIRPLVMDNREDPNTFDIDDQFMFGEFIMAAPLVSGTRREAYFPHGRWTHVETGETVHGGTRVAIDSPLERVPMYVPDGAVVPLGPALPYGADFSGAPLTVHVYCGQSGRFDLFEDDGVTYGYEKGACAVTPLEYREYLDRREIRLGPARGSYPGRKSARNYMVILHHAPSPQAVKRDGRALPSLSDGEAASGVPGWTCLPDETLILRLDQVTAAQGTTVVLETGPVKADADGFLPLFNGKDLTGWQIMGRHGDWHVENGEVVCTGRSGEFLDWIRSADEYEDFILQLEYNMGPNCNSGVFIRTTETGRQSRTGMEVQILDDPGKPPNTHSSGAIYDLVAPRSNAARPAGEWNRLEIACVGRTLNVTLNGTRIHDLNLDGPAGNADVPDGRKLSQRAKRGYIGLQNHAKPIRFRNVRIRILPP